MDLQKHFLIIFASMLALLLLGLFLYNETIRYEDKIAEASARRYQSFLLADELRQSSDDLTRMARTYAVTGDPKFKEYFDRILAIRGGEAPRPVDYHKIYWDFVVATGMPPRVDMPPKSLRQLMKEAAFTESEFALLQETENESNQLVNLENQAMNAMEGIFEDAAGRFSKGAPNRELARDLLHSDAYHRAKEKIMAPLEDFFEIIDHRTSGEIALYIDKQQRVNLVLMLTLGLASILALVSLALGGWWSLRRKSAQSGKSRLAQRLAASGYTPADAAGKGSARDALVRKLTTKVEPAVQAGKEVMVESTSLQVFLGTFWQNWPLIIAAIIITFLTLGLSGWFLSENRIQAESKVRDELKFTLDSTRDAVLDWLEQTSQETIEFADTISQEVVRESSQWINEADDDKLSPVLAGTLSGDGDNELGLIDLELHMLAEQATIAQPDLFDNYLIVDPNGIVLSSNRGDLIGKYFVFPDGTMERLQAEKTVVNFPHRDAKNELLSSHIVFGSLIGESKGAVFIMTSPQRMLAKVLRRGYSGNYGEVYLVDAQGRFISEPRWKEQIFDRGWAVSETRSVVGLYAVPQGKLSETGKLPLSVRRVITGDSGGELQEYNNYLDEKVVGYWNWNNTYGFGIINEFRSDDAFATSRAFTTQTMVGSGLTAALILALTLMSIWSRSTVTKASEKLQIAFKTIKSHNDKLAQDLRIGQKVQMDMLPDPIQGQGFALEAFLKPAQSVSGDFYDYSLIQDNKIYFCVGDVSGKGIPASLFMSMSKALLNKMLDQTDQTKDIVTRVNTELSQNNESNMFVTLIVGIMDLRSGQLLLTNGGHNLPYIKKHTGELICLEEVQGPLVGTFEGIEFEQQSLTMEQGDMILLYTDGVTEAQNIRDEFYEDDRLKDLLEKNRFDTAKDMTSAIFRNVVRFIGRAEQFDDITILTFQYTGK